MRLRTLLGLLAVTVFVLILASTIAMNQAPVEVHLLFTPPLTLQLWAVMLAAFGAGAVLILFFDIAGGARRFARNVRARKLHRAHEKTEDLFLGGLQDLVNGRYEEALASFERVLSRDPDHVNALVKRGDSLRSLKRYRQAIDSLEKAIRLEPDNLVGLYSLTDVYLETGEEARGEEILKRIVRFDPGTTVSAHRKLRDLKVKQGQWKAADELQQKIEAMVTLGEEKERARANSIGIRYELGRELLGQGQLKQAVASFNSVLRWDEGFVPAYLKLGEAQLAAGETEEAIASWRQGYQATQSIELLSALQNHYLRNEEPEEAIAIWKEAITRADDDSPLRYCLGKLYQRLFMLDEALREFRRVEERAASPPALQVYIARILESKGDLRGALAEIKTLLGEVGDLLTDYRCHSCQKRFSAWTDRCDRCARWNTIALDLRAVAVPEPRIRPAPTWSSS